VNQLLFSTSSVEGVGKTNSIPFFFSLESLCSGLKSPGVLYLSVAGPRHCPLFPPFLLQCFPLVTSPPTQAPPFCWLCSPLHLSEVPNTGYRPLPIKHRSPIITIFFSLPPPVSWRFEINSGRPPQRRLFAHGKHCGLFQFFLFFLTQGLDNAARFPFILKSSFFLLSPFVN